MLLSLLRILERRAVVLEGTFSHLPFLCKESASRQSGAPPAGVNVNASAQRSPRAFGLSLASGQVQACRRAALSSWLPTHEGTSSRGISTRVRKAYHGRQ